jgi:hypothetical protein
MAGWSVLHLLAVVATVESQASTKLSSKGCAEPFRPRKCQSLASDATSSCISQANKDKSQQELLACTYENYNDDLFELILQAP